MAKEPPKWLTAAAIENALQKDIPDLTKIVALSVKPAVPVGDNTTSDIYRVQVDYTVAGTAGHQTMSLIVKTPLDVGPNKDSTEKMDFYASEHKMYKEILPKLREKVAIDFGPKFYSSPAKNAMVLEDMNAEGYVLVNRHKQMDYAHCKYVMETMAKYHAASVALYHDDPELVKAIGKERAFVNDGPYTEYMKLFFGSCVTNLLQAIEDMGGQEAHMQLISGRADSLWDFLTNLLKPKEHILNVLNHGDCWINNMLVKYNDLGEISDMKLIDFQFPRFGSPVIDLIYFLLSSPNEDVRENKFQELCNVYLTALNRSLEVLGCDESLTEEQLTEELEGSRDWAISVLCFAIPLMQCNSENAVDAVTIEYNHCQGDNKFKKLCEGPEYKEKLPGYLRQLCNWNSLMKRL